MDSRFTKTISRWIIIIVEILYSMFLVINSEHQGYSIGAPTQHTAFVGDLKFNYSLPIGVSHAHAFIQLDRHLPDGTSETIDTFGLAVGRNFGQLRSSCGVIDVAGKYSLKLFPRVGGNTLTESPLTVVWPKSSLTFPQHIQAQRDSAVVNITSSASCLSIRKRFKWKVVLYFQRTDFGGKDLNLKTAEVLQSRVMSNPTMFTQMSFGCQIFELNGYYQVILKSTGSAELIIGKSNVMNVTWGGGYRLESGVSSIFPCDHSVRLYYAHPPCSGKDKIRLYALYRKVSGTMSAPLSKEYVVERLANPMEAIMDFVCETFNKSAAGFCFSYDSVTKNGAVTEQKEVCLPAQYNSVFPIDGGWSDWTSWTACSVSCGFGKKIRYRMCNKPAPKHGGRFCVGETKEWLPCHHVTFCPETIPRTPLHAIEIPEDCSCGCARSESQGEIIATGRCQGFANWTVFGSPGEVVALQFGYFNLNFSRQWVRIRNGALPSDSLLFFSSDQGYPVEIVTSGSAMRIEMMTIYPNQQTSKVIPKIATLPIHAHGFVAKYEIRVPGITSTASPLFQYQEKTVFGNIVTIVGIVICLLVIAVAIIFVVLHKTVFRRKFKYSIATTKDSPSIEQPISPEHQISSGHSSSAASPVLNEDERPLTGKMKRKEYKNKAKTNSRGSTTSDLGSLRSTQPESEIRKHRSKKTKKKSAGKDTSPSGIEIKDEELSNKDGVTIKLKGTSASNFDQENTTIQKHSMKTSLPSTSKFDILSKKRQVKNSRLGSQSNASNQNKNSYISTTKAEVNYPQTHFVKNTYNERGKYFPDRTKKSQQRPPSEEIPLIDSSQDSPSHINVMIRSDSSADSATTSFTGLRTTQIRRPTSLTESYSSEALKKILNDKPEAEMTPTSSTESSSDKTTEITLKPNSIKSKTSTPVSGLPAEICVTPVNTNFNKTPIASPRLQEVPSPQYSYSSQNATPVAIESKDFPKDTIALKKIENPTKQKSNNKNQNSTYSKTIKCENSEEKQEKFRNNSEKQTTLESVASPARSMNSEFEAPELEYDDFVEDDPLSYFDFEETQKLAFRGAEKLGKTPLEEEEEEEHTIVLDL